MPQRALNESQRVLLLKYYFEQEMGSTEIAKIFNVSRTTILNEIRKSGKQPREKCSHANTYAKRKIKGIIDQFQQQNSLSMPINEDDIHIVDGFVGKGYALISDTEISLIKKMARTEGIVMDPVYTAKAFLGMLAQLREQKSDFKKNLFIHTGGIFSIFAHVAALRTV